MVYLQIEMVQLNRMSARIFTGMRAMAYFPSKGGRMEALQRAVR